MADRAPKQQPGIDGVVDELLALPPEQFTQARNDAAKRLRQQGQRDAADEIKGLPRPPLSLWVLNRLASEQPKLMETFLRSAGELREAYRSGGDVRAATAPERDAEARVAAAAVELARGEGRELAEAAVDRLRQTLRAAAADGEVASALRDGRLLREPAAPSLDALLGSLPQSTAASKAKAAPKRDRGAERMALREQIAAAKQDASDARSEARAAADAARAAQREAERAQKAAGRAQQRNDAAAERLGELQAQLDAL